MAAFEFRLNPAPRHLGISCAILNGRAKHYRVENYRTTLSIKAVQQGAALYVTPRSRHLVTPDYFLILNNGQDYSLNFNWPAPTETLCPFFQPGFVEHAAYCMTTSASKQLDGIEASTRPLRFTERLYPRTGSVGAMLNDVHLGIIAGHAGHAWLEDRFHMLAESLVELSEIERREIDQIVAARVATRKELYRRLHRGREYLSAFFAQPVTVAKAASAASLSPFHFHRQFKAVFGQTPMQFVQACRLDTARRMLVETDMPITQVCFSVGFESLGSFSSLFRKRFGLSPRQFRGKEDS